MSDTEIKVLEAQFKDHCEQNIGTFERINRALFKLDEKLDQVVLGVARLEVLEVVAKDTGASAGKRTAQVWAAFISILVVVLDKVLEKIF